MRIIIKWIGNGGKVVPRNEAERRAMICATCPMNKRFELYDVFKKKAADAIKRQLAKKNKMFLTTLLDPILGICDACKCVNQLKVHTPSEIIKKHMKPEIIARTHEDCWMRTI